VGGGRAVTACGLLIAALLIVDTDPRPVPPPAAAPPAYATVTVHGHAGTFGSVGGTTPSGQEMARTAVPGWEFPPGVQAYRSALAADGTVLLAGAGQDWLVDVPTADQTVVGAYHPRRNTFTSIRIGPVGPGAPSVMDLLPVDGGVAFVTRSPPAPAAGRWPAFGVLATVDGRWVSAPVRGSVPGGDLNDVARLPRSRDLVVARHGERGGSNGGLLALRLTGPDRQGQFAVAVTGEYRYPALDHARVSVREVQADPTARRGDERFAVGLDLDPGKGPPQPAVLQEFSYDAATGAIRPVSAPILPGDRTTTTDEFYAYGTFLYDRAGNLWVSRSTGGFGGGKLAIYAAGAGRRRLDAGGCGLRPGRRIDRYRVSAGGRTAWGLRCRPDYDILQTQELVILVDLVQDPVTGVVVALSLGGTMLAIRAAPAAGDGLRFQVGTPVDLGRKLLPTAANGLTGHRLGAVDPGHRVWVSALQAAYPPRAGVQLDQWLYSVDVGDLFAPAPVPLPATPGRSVTIQAERSATVSTTAKKGTWAAVDIESDAYARGCGDWPSTTTCGYDGVAGNGFVLGDDSGFGKLGGAVEYGVQVPAAGEYRLSYRVATFAVTTTARIALTAGGRRYVEPVSTGGAWRTVRAAEPVTLPAGRQTITLSVPPGAGGWYLNWFALQRI
jgi:hypothetical protein